MLIAGLSLASCTKTESPYDFGVLVKTQISFPEVTQDGKNILAFKTNKSAFISHNAVEAHHNNGEIIHKEAQPLELTATYALQAETQEYVLVIWGLDQKDDKNKRDELTIKYRSELAIKAGDRIVIGSNEANGMANVSFWKTVGDRYIEYKAISGELNILKLDSQRKIISATFNFTGEEVKKNETEVESAAVLATEGRLDILYTDALVKK